MTLDTLYTALERQLPPTDGNPCGQCRACCTGSGLTAQHVLEVEHLALAARFGEAASRAFREYAERRRDAHGALLHEICPFYDDARRGCSIYAHRPFSCRVFGHFRMRGTRLPDDCVFEPTVREVNAAGYFREVPLARNLRALQREHDLRTPAPAAGSGESASEVLRRVRETLDPDDPFDLALAAQIEGRHEEALRILQEAQAERSDDPHLLLSLGNVLDALGRTPEAIGAYNRVLSIDPSYQRAWTHLGFSRLELGDAPGARDAFDHAVSIAPTDAVARGFLGWLTMGTATTHEAFGEAAHHLREATRLDPSNTPFRLRCAEALILVDASHEASGHLRAALADPRLAGAARSLAERFCPEALDGAAEGPSEE